jgi:hypothetical protein
MMLWKRTLRTLTSERFVAIRGGADVAAVDIHYLASGDVTGTVFLYESAGWTDADVNDLLRSLDDVMLPDVNLSDGSLTYTVVRGHVLGTYEATEDPSS